MNFSFTEIYKRALSNIDRYVTDREEHWLYKQILIQLTIYAIKYNAVLPFNHSLSIEVKIPRFPYTDITLNRFKNILNTLITDPEFLGLKDTFEIEFPTSIKKCDNHWSIVVIIIEKPRPICRFPSYLEMPEPPEPDIDISR